MAKVANKVVGIGLWAVLPWPVVLFASGWAGSVIDVLFDPNGYHPVATVFLWLMILSPLIGVWRLARSEKSVAGAVIVMVVTLVLAMFILLMIYGLLIMSGWIGR